MKRRALFRDCTTDDNCPPEFPKCNDDLLVFIHTNINKLNLACFTFGTTPEISSIFN